jgi:hypothetical protein
VPQERQADGVSSMLRCCLQARQTTGSRSHPGHMPTHTHTHTHYSSHRHNDYASWEGEQIIRSRTIVTCIPSSPSAQNRFLLRYRDARGSLLHRTQVSLGKTCTTGEHRHTHTHKHTHTHTTHTHTHTHTTLGAEPPRSLPYLLSPSWTQDVGRYTLIILRKSKCGKLKLSATPARTLIMTDLCSGCRLSPNYCSAISTFV